MTPHAVALYLLGGLLAMSTPAADAARSYDFDGGISRPVLESYLSRATTMMDLLSGKGDEDDNIRMLRDIGAKFAGRAVYRWGSEADLPALLQTAADNARKVHAAIPDMILQGAVFEIVTTQVEKLPVPAFVLEEFGQTPVERCFDYETMLFPDGRFVDHWSPGASVPDMRRLETRMWFYFVATAYIDLGCEAIHFGQVHLIGAEDEGFAAWWDMLSRVRRYASGNARRHMVLCDAHTHGVHFGGDRLLFDFHAYPLRIREIADRPQEGELVMGHLDTIFGRSAGGITPSGWECEHLPYLVELDNWGSSGKEGQAIGDWWTWGWDEISWFAHQPEEYRNGWLKYAWHWVREHDPNGYLQMPGSRCLHHPVDGRLWWYFANRRSAASPDGYGQEDTIREIWAGTE